MISLGIHDTPVDRSSHKTHTPTAGGVGFILAFLIFSLLAYFMDYVPPSEEMGIYFCFLLGIIILGVVGFLDDHKTLSYKIRLLFQILCSGMVISSGLYIKFPVLAGDPSLWQKMLTLLAFLGLINGANFIDGLNGLLAGCFLIASGFMALIISETYTFVHILYAILFGSVLGFYIFNFPRASIFMGDVGSTFIGFSLGFLALLSQNYYQGDTHSAIVHKGFVYTLSPLMFLWFDVGFTLLRRIYKKAKLTEAHRDHMIHVLHDQGYSHTQVSLIYYGLTLFMCLVTWLCFLDLLTFIQGLVIYLTTQALFCFWVFTPKPASHEME
jgi:UDP-N-acetylmuramyl pentapeptide phosphotransferase/UDP-N-acetylglucosamine-1-phosphate transferase